MKRYDPAICSSEIFQGMALASDGDYVEFSDVKALIKTVKEIVDELENLSYLTLESADNATLMAMAERLGKYSGS